VRVEAPEDTIYTSVSKHRQNSKKKVQIRNKKTKQKRRITLCTQDFFFLFFPLIEQMKKVKEEE